MTVQKKLLAFAFAMSLLALEPVVLAEAAHEKSDDKTNHWEVYGGKSFWYENGEKQGTLSDLKGVIGDGTVRGREIVDPNVLDDKGNGTWFWLDAHPDYDGAKACDKEVWMPYIHQNEKNWGYDEISRVAAESGDMAAQVEAAMRAAKDGETDSGIIGKWVRYDSEGRMIKGWYKVEGTDCDLYPSQAGNTYYYDYKTGLMAKGKVAIDGSEYVFDEVSGKLLSGKSPLDMDDSGADGQENASYLSRSVEGIYDSSEGFVLNWANVSMLQQFAYKNEGLAYAYQDQKDGKLHIVTPSKELELEMKYPELGDVISDKAGNFYIIWGKENPWKDYETRDATVETVVISKYAPNGTFVKSTGFVGRSKPWGDDDSAKTMRPFNAGNCVSVIHDNVLVCYHAKQRYDGHQSDQVIAVDIRDMSPHELSDATYSGHSFNQDVIYSSRAEDFIFASHGDAYSRGFRVNRPNSFYGNDNEVIFHFYLQANANYNMYVVNRTFAQLGGLAETDEGMVVLAGASAKSIGENAKNEKQNLFIQIFDPTGEISESMFVGGERRTGATSFNINDNANSPLTDVTDYGVIWLTDNTDKDVIAPMVVAAGGKIAVFWNESEVGERGFVTESFYMLLSETGEIIKQKTSLGEFGLNSYEKPIYHNGEIQWAYCDKGVIRVVKIKL